MLPSMQKTQQPQFAEYDVVAAKRQLAPTVPADLHGTVLMIFAETGKSIAYLIEFMEDVYSSELHTVVEDDLVLMQHWREEE